MNTSSDAAEQIVRMSLEGFQVAAKVTGSGAKDIAALLYAVMKDNQKTKGKTRLTNMLKSGKELKVFSVRKNDFKKFTEEAKRYGVLYCALNNKKDMSSDGIIDIIVRSEDAPKINRIVDRFKLSSFDEASIRSEIEKDKNEKESKDKGVKTKSVEDKEQDDKKVIPIKKVEEQNPRLAKTEKSPQSEPSLEMQKTLDQGTRDFFARPSVREKLNKAKEEFNKKIESRKKSKVHEHKPVSKKKQRKKVR